MSLKVIIVDDDPLINFLHEKITERSGLCKQPLCFVNGNEALDYFIKEVNTVDSYLILLDIKMPEMDGWQLLDELKMQKIYNQIYVVMVTSSVDNEDHKKAKLYTQVINYIEKPLSLHQLHELKQMKEIKDFLDSSS
jgi:CheY-like chemotaxis protein